MATGAVGPRVAALVASAPTLATVGVASAQVLPLNTARTSLRMINTSSNTIFLGLGQAAVLNSGMVLIASGGTWNMDAGDFTTQAIFAIASGAGSNLAIQEFI